MNFLVKKTIRHIITYNRDYILFYFIIYVIQTKSIIYPWFYVKTFFKTFMIYFFLIFSNKCYN